MRFGAILAMVLTGACSSLVTPPPKMHRCGPGENISGQPAQAFGVVGHEVSVAFVFSADCDGGTPITLFVSGNDPDNVAFDLDAGASSFFLPQNSGIGYGTATFIPAMPGPYHFTARLEPNLGTHQVDIYVAADHTLESPAFSVTPPDGGLLGACTHVELTPSSHVLCLAPSSALFETDGGWLQDFGSASAAYDNGALWLADDVELSRWVEGLQADGGDGLVRSPDTAFQLTSPRPLLMPTDAGVVTFDSMYGFTRFALTDAGLTLTGRAFVDLTPGVAWATDHDALLLGDNFTGIASASFDSTAKGFDGALRFPLGVNRDGLWISDDAFFGQHTLNVRTSSVAPDVMIVPDDVPIVAAAHPVLWDSWAPLTSNGLLFIVGRPNGIFSLDAYPTQFPLVSATGTAVTLNQGGALNIYRR